MSNGYKEVDGLLAQLQCLGISSIQGLRLLVFLRNPRRPAEVFDELGIERTILRRMYLRSPKLIDRIELTVDPDNRERGKNPIAYTLTNEGRYFVDRIFKP